MSVQFALCHIATDAKSQFIGKDPDDGKVWGQEEKGETENETVGWHHQFNGHESEQTLGDSEGQGSLACCSPWDCKELDMTQPLNSNIPTDCSLVTVMLNLDFFSYLLVGPAAGNISPPESLSPPETNYIRMVSSLRSTVLTGSGTSALCARCFTNESHLLACVVSLLPASWPLYLGKAFSWPHFTWPEMVSPLLCHSNSAIRPSPTQHSYSLGSFSSWTLVHISSFYQFPVSSYITCIATELHQFEKNTFIDSLCYYVV